MPPTASITHKPASIVFKVRLTPKGGRDRLDGWSQTADGTRHVKARVSAPPDKGKANEALVALLAAHLHIPKSSLFINAGETGRLKTLEAHGDPQALAARLEMLGEAK